MPALDKVSVLRLPAHSCDGVERLCDADFARPMMYTFLFYCTCNGVSVTDVMACSKQATYHMVGFCESMRCCSCALFCHGKPTWTSVEQVEDVVHWTSLAFCRCSTVCASPSTKRSLPSRWLSKSLYLLTGCNLVQLEPRVLHRCLWCYCKLQHAKATGPGCLLLVGLIEEVSVVVHRNLWRSVEL